MAKAALIGGAIVLLGVGIAFKIGSDSGNGQQSTFSGSSQQSTFINQPETNSPQMPASNQDDWYRAVCRLGTITPGSRVLRGAIAGDSCIASDGPIFIGEYNSSLAMDNDIARFHGNAHTATIADDSGNLWLFLAMTPRASAALESLRQFGFTVA